MPDHYERQEDKDFLADRRREQYGAVSLKNAHLMNFKAPFLHLNHLAAVISEDNDAIMRVRGEPAIGDDHMQVMTILWDKIDDVCQTCGYDIFGALGQFNSGLSDDITLLRRHLARLEAACDYVRHTHPDQLRAWYYTPYIPTLMEKDFEFIVRRDQEYNASWLRRGGVGAFMMLARKWDRFEPMVAAYNNRPIAMLAAKPDRIDDVQDLRRYLALVQSEWNRRRS